jgi:ribosomal protein S12 methylthiotransferase accessory factor
MSIRPNSETLAVSQGKGMDTMSAKVSALMEALELWHCENFDAPVTVASFDSLEPGAALDPLKLPRPVHLDLDLSAEIEFVTGFELFARRPVLCPREIVGQNWADPRLRARMFLQCGNGLASGNDAIEATVHGLCEVIERDAMVRWFLDRSRAGTKATQLDLRTVGDEHVRELLDHLEERGVIVAAWELTTDIGIPAFAAAILDPPGWRAKDISYGFGCHLSPSVALSRTLTEAAQCRLTEIAGSRDDIPPKQYTPVDPARTRGFIKILREPAPTRDFAAIQDRSTSTIDGDLEVILESLRGAGLTSAAVFDMSRPNFDVAVVRVVVPELEAYTDVVEVHRGPRAKRWLTELARRHAGRGEGAA